MVGEHSLDVECVVQVVQVLARAGRTYDCSSILRPTNPFRRAWGRFAAKKGADSLRAVEKCKQHPGKMWVIRGPRMVPRLPSFPADKPWHGE